MFNFNENAQIYYTYMKHLSERYKPTNHEGGFFRGELEEFYQALRSKVEFPCLVVEGFKNELDNPSSDRYFKCRTTSFTVVCSYQEYQNYDAIEKALGESEEHGEEFIKQMLFDGRESDCQVLIEDISTLIIDNAPEKYIGLRYTFTIKSFFNTQPNKTIWRKS